MINIKQTIKASIQQSIENINISLNMLDKLEIAANMLISALKNKKKILICGNGGSAADAQHMVAEIVGRFEVEREALPAIALNTDTSILTAVANDYGYEYIFSRQIEALGHEDDILIAISTSGNSKNVIQAIHVAQQRNMKIIGFCGKAGGEMSNLLNNNDNINLCASGSNTARIQEVHAIWIHVLCEIIDKVYTI
jgi:D-sedoheptulose 7-phosphate isomerase